MPVVISFNCCNIFTLSILKWVSVVHASYKGKDRKGVLWVRATGETCRKMRRGDKNVSRAYTS
jgi:hypothetical protein